MIDMLGTFIAEEEPYESLLSDMSRIAATMPQIPKPLPSYLPAVRRAGRTIRLRMPNADTKRYAAGGDPVWDCLAAYYGLSGVSTFSTLNLMTVSFGGVYDATILADEYAQRIPEAGNAGPSGFVNPSGSALLIGRAAGKWHYFFGGFRQRCQLFCGGLRVHYVTSVRSFADPTASLLSYKGSWSSADPGPEPPWWVMVTALLNGQPITGLAPVPAGQPLAYFVFALLIVFAARRALPVTP